MKTYRLALWVFVVLCGIELGAGIFESRVLIPLWAAHPPESVWATNALFREHRELMADAGRNFWMVSTPLVAIAAIVALISCLVAKPPERRLVVTATLMVIGITIVTFVYFVPTLIQIHRSSPTASAPNLASVVDRWVILNWIRTAIYIGAWLCALRAMAYRVPPLATMKPAMVQG